MEHLDEWSRQKALGSQWSMCVRTWLLLRGQGRGEFTGKLAIQSSEYVRVLHQSTISASPSDDPFRGSDL